MRTLVVATIATLLLAGAAPPARAGNAVGALAPYEDLLEVLAPLTWHLRDDLYRFSAPSDPTGHDLFQLSLARLDGWEKRYPSTFRDITTFARAEVLERIGEYQKATDAYRQVAATSGSPLADAAKGHAARTATFAAAAAMPEAGGDLDKQLAAFRKKLDAWGAIVDQQAGTPYQSIALVEEERLERLTSGLVVAHRQLLDKGDETAERALRFLIEKHAETKELPTHILRLGDLYADFAHEYADAHERPLDFMEDDFIARADRALDVYRKVATWDGVREKPEGQARFAALEAYKANVLARHR
jgi:tetratricopeptide (TPR) repeat protein